MRYALRVPSDNPRGPAYMEQALASIHQGNPGRESFQLEIAHHNNQLILSCHFPPKLRPLILEHVRARYPDCQFEELSQELAHLATGERCWSADLTLAPDLFPIKRYPQFEDSINRTTVDPLAGLLASLDTGEAERVRCSIRITVRPARRSQRQQAQACLRSLTNPIFSSYPRVARRFLQASRSSWRLLRLAARFAGFLLRQSERHAFDDALHTSTTRWHDRQVDLQAASDKIGKHLFEVAIRIFAVGSAEAAKEARQRLTEITSAFGQFHAPRLAEFRVSRFGSSWLARPGSILLSNEELATLWHPPTSAVQAPTLASVESREFMPSVQLPTVHDHPGLAAIGTTVRGQEFGIFEDDRRRHMVILGKTGQGKSTLLLQLLTSEILAGRGIGLIDPHADLADALLARIPKRRTNDVALFDAADRRFPPAFNVLASTRSQDRSLLASGVVATFQKLYSDFWGPRTEHLLRNGVLALLEIPDASLLCLLQLLGDDSYRRFVAGRVSDPVVRAFWQREFADMPPRLQAEAVAPLQNKLGQFLSSPLIRNIVGQAQNRFDLRDIMDEGRILIVNLSKGKIGEDASALLGSLLVTRLQIAAMSRAALAEEERRDFALHIDEFQNFATDSFAAILSEARKYRLSLTLANQYLSQLSPSMLAAIFGNVGSLVAFQVAVEDAEVLAQQFGERIAVADFVNLPRYQAYIRLLINGAPSKPFSMRTLPPISTSVDPDRADIIRRYCRQRYSRPKTRVEAETRQCFGHMFDP